MTPSNLSGCWHSCCANNGFHEHDTTPETCDECAAVTAESENARRLRERAQRIGGLNPKDATKETK